MKLLPSQCTFCVQNTAMHHAVYSATSFKDIYVGACVFSCILPAALLAKSFAEVAFLKLGVYDTLIFSSV